jgi:hypothetical protein
VVRKPTNSKTVFAGCKWPINKAVECPETNRCDLLVAICELSEECLNCAGGLRCDSESGLSDFTCGLRLARLAFADDCVEVNRGSDEVDVACDMRREMVGVAS